MANNYQTKGDNKIKIIARSENGKSYVKYFINGKEISAYGILINSILNFGKVNKLEAMSQN